MLYLELKSNIRKLWDKFWNREISNPLKIIKQIDNLIFMKRLVILFILLMPFAYGLCSESDGGNVVGTFGYTEVDGVKYADACISAKNLKEYYCSGASYSSATSSCLSCKDGMCYQSACAVANECNPILKKWCDGSGWLDSGYCSDSNLGCYLEDSSCGASVCNSGACDYANYKYCSGNEWLSDDYCDFTICGNDEKSLGYCFCVESEDVEGTCNDDKDNDCDGSVDCHDDDCDGLSGCECSESETRSCSSDVGECVIGMQACVAGSWGECSGVEVSSEKCDYLDNDCDGIVDEECTCVAGDTRDCGVSVGVCKAGVQVCSENNVWSVCYGASYAASKIESCDGLDNDCDGIVDEGCGCVAESNQSCGSEIGACKLGLQLCVNGSWSDCDGGIEVFPEICGDYIDNDCDGLVDSEDDVCSATNITIVSNIPEVECVFDYDCEARFVCESNECVEEVIEEEIVEENTGGLSSGLASNDFVEEESFDYGSLIIPVVVVLLIVAGVGIYLLQKRKKSSTKVEVKKESPKINLVTKPLMGKFLKSAAERDLEKSINESKNIFKK